MIEHLPIYAAGTRNGLYQPRGDMATINPDNALFVGHAYGQAPDGGPGLSNIATAAVLDTEVYADFQKIVSKDIYPAMRTEPNAVMTGGATNMTGSEGIGTTGELKASIQYAALNGLTKLVLFGQNHHIGRVGKQADAENRLLAKAGLDTYDIIIPDNLHGVFDPQSLQSWCQDPKVWWKRERFAVPYLYLKGQLK